MAYDNSKRAARAAETRSRVLAAASAEFLAGGYAATTIRDVADRAGVSAETIYKTFKTKAALLKQVYDIALAGDDEPLPVIARPEGRAVVAARTPAEAARAYAHLAATVSTQTGPLLRVLLGARATDPDLQAFVETIDGERLTGASRVTEHWAGHGWLRPTLDPGTARDIVWTLTSPGVHHHLQDRGWSSARYEDWLATVLAATVLTA